MAIKVHVNDPLDKSAYSRLKDTPGLEVTSFYLDKDQLKEKVNEFDVLVVRSASKVTKEIIEAGKNLKIIARAGTGLDNVDVAAAKEKGIKVVNTPGANSISVAELAIGLMLSMFRHIPRGTCGIKSGKWEKKELKGRELFGKTVGVIGFGAIGREVAKRIIPFGCKILAYDVVQNNGGLEVEFVSLEELYKSSDIITVHTPLIEATKKLLNEKAFSLMKEGVFIIDAARGGIIDEKALVDALESGKVDGAALDVFEVEPPVDELRTRLVKNDKVICTPHIGASTSEAQERVGEQIVDILIEEIKNL